MAVSSAFVGCPKLETLLNHHNLSSSSALQTPLGFNGVRVLPKNNRIRRGLTQRARCELSSANAASISALEQLKNSAADRYTKERSSIVVIGLSIHTAPVEMREKLAIPEAEWPRAIAELCGLNHIEEAAVLSTCNRMEIYVLALSQHRGVKEVTEWMSKTSGIGEEENPKSFDCFSQTLLLSDSSTISLSLMAELTQADVVYSTRSLQVWTSLMNCLAFFYQIFLQILRAVGYHPLLSSSVKSTADGFSPLPAIELLDRSSDSPTTVEIAEAISGSGVSERNRFQKLKVVLDLDETLVCAYETSSLPAALRNQAIEAGLKWFEIECLSTDKECDGRPKINYVTVFERPGLHEFLEKLSQFADLVLFTAGLEGYAKPLVDKIDTRKVLSNRLYRPSTVNTQYRDHVKDLLSTSKNMSRTVIVDNNPFSFLLQPSNGIPCIAFTAGHPNDAQLLDVILPLLKQLSEEDDVRPTLYDRFRMPEWFEKQGIPPSCWNP